MAAYLGVYDHLLSLFSFVIMSYPSQSFDPAANGQYGDLGWLEPARDVFRKAWIITLSFPERCLSSSTSSDEMPKFALVMRIV